MCVAVVAVKWHRHIDCSAKPIDRNPNQGSKHVRLTSKILWPIVMTTH